MRYLLLLLAFTLASCNKYSEQIQVVKDKAAKYAPPGEADKYNYTVTETPDTVVYNRLIAHYAERAKEGDGNPYDPNTRLFAEKADSVKRAKNQGLNKTFYTVRAQYKQDGHETVKDFYLADDNRIIGSELIKYE